MYTRNNNGPRTEPWGTPLVTLPTVDCSPPTETTKVRSAKNSVIPVKYGGVEVTVPHFEKEQPMVNGVESLCGSPNNKPPLEVLKS